MPYALRNKHTGQYLNYVRLIPGEHNIWMSNLTYATFCESKITAEINLELRKNKHDLEIVEVEIKLKENE